MKTLKSIFTAAGLVLLAFIAGAVLTTARAQSVAGGNASGRASMSVGAMSEASGDTSTAIGMGSSASGPGSLGVGLLSSARGLASTSVGASSAALGGASVALGSAAVATGTNSTVLGTFGSAVGANSVAVGSSSDAPDANTVSLGSAEFGRQQTRRLVNMSDGIDNNDGATVGQLRSGLASVSNLSSQIDSNARQSNAGIAAALAVAGAAPAIAPEIGHTTGGVGLGAYGGQAAISASFVRGFATSGGKPFYGRVSLAVAGGRPALSAGISFGF